MQEVKAHLADQLGRLASVWRDARDNATEKSERLQDAIVDAVDEGASVSRVARLVGLSPARVYAIIQKVDGRA